MANTDYALRPGSGGFAAEIAHRVWAARYRATLPNGRAEPNIDATWQRVATAVARGEHHHAQWRSRFLDALRDFRFLPGGRILAGAGSGRRVTLLNCFVMGTIDDSLDGIFGALREGALTMQQGGGVGYDFSTLRPAGTPARTTGQIASGPTPFLDVWDAMCATVLSTGARRGAMMATLRCDHPDIEAFVAAKDTAGRLRHFNLSVQVTDAFLRAVEADTDWPLVFPAAAVGNGDGEAERVTRPWPGRDGAVTCRVLRRVRARALWDRIVGNACAHGEPGVLFVDRINALNTLWYREHISATNPCGEAPLPPYGACNLGSINLVPFVESPFRARARLDLEGLARTAATATRFLDDVIDETRYPLPQQAAAERDCRRIGLGITGLADALILLGLHYDSDAAREQAAEAMRTIAHAAWRTSIELAREKGACRAFRRDDYLAGAYVRSLPGELRDGIARHGIRNGHLTAIAPAGTISMLAGAVSSGIEPVYAFDSRRRLRGRDGRCEMHAVCDAAWRMWHEHHRPRTLPRSFVTATELSTDAHLAMQAALQPHVDGAISKTINIPADASPESFRDVYRKAWQLGLKGCTAFRPNPVTGTVIEPAIGENGRHGGEPDDA